MRKEVLGGLTRDQLEIQLKHSENYIEKLIDENKSLKQQNDCLKNIFETAYIPESAESMMRNAGLFTEEEIRQLSKENTMLKETVRLMTDEKLSLTQRIKDLEDVCDGSRFSDEEDDRDKLISELQDQHQQDCIRINDLATTVHVLAGLYSTLRKTVGMD